MVVLDLQQAGDLSTELFEKVFFYVIELQLQRSHPPPPKLNSGNWPLPQLPLDMHRAAQVKWHWRRVVLTGTVFGRHEWPMYDCFILSS